MEKFFTDFPRHGQIISTAWKNKVGTGQAIVVKHLHVGVKSTELQRSEIHEEVSGWFVMFGNGSNGNVGAGGDIAHQ
jgi:hypothetical protein